MASVTFSASVGGDGSTVTDDTNATTGLAAGGHRTRFVPALAQVVAVASNTVTKATEAATSASNASTSASSASTSASNASTSASNAATSATNAANSATQAAGYAGAAGLLISDAANQVTQRNGANAQKFSVHNTYTSATVYERFAITWAGNIVTLGTEHSGGTQRAMNFSASSFTFAGATSVTGAFSASGQATGSAEGGGTASAFYASSAAPSFGWRESDQATDEKVWDALVSAKTWTLRTVTDNNASAVNAITITRSTGTAISSIAFAGNTAVTGTLSASGLITASNGLSIAASKDITFAGNGNVNIVNGNGIIWGSGPATYLIGSDSSNFIKCYVATVERVTVNTSGVAVTGSTSATTALAVTGNGHGLTGASRLIMDDNAGTARFYAYGPDASTVGSFEWHLIASGGSPDTTAMTLNSSGRLVIGPTSDAGISTGTSNNPGVAIERMAAIASQRNDDANFYISKAAGYTSGYYMRFWHNGSEVGSISTNSTNTAYTTSSDRRLKENIVDAADAGSIIDAIHVRAFNWKADNSYQAFGFIAQELHLVFPAAVTTGDTWAVDNSKLVPPLVKVAQSHQQRIAQLEARVAELESLAHTHA